MPLISVRSFTAITKYMQNENKTKWAQIFTSQIYFIIFMIKIGLFSKTIFYCCCYNYFHYIQKLQRNTRNKFGIALSQSNRIRIIIFCKSIESYLIFSLNWVYYLKGIVYIKKKTTHDVYMLFYLVSGHQYKKRKKKKLLARSNERGRAWERENVVEATSMKMNNNTKNKTTI